MSMPPSLRRGAASLSLAAACAALILILPLPSLLAAPDDPKITLGVLRRDGLLVPFGSYNGHDWAAPWPNSLAGRALPIAVDDIPKDWWGAAGPGAAWTAWLPDPTLRSQPLHLDRPVQYPVFCVTRLGVTTDYQGPPLTERAPTLPKDGLAIAGGATLLPIGTMPPNTKEPRRMADLILDEFNREERKAAQRFVSWTHPFKQADRERLPIEIESYYRSTETTSRGAWTVSYIEAVRKFPPGPQDRGCGLITYANGWVTEREGKKPDIRIGARVTYCDRDGVSFMQPFGRLVLKDEVYWVYQLSSWNDEIYVVSRIRPTEIRAVVAVSGGACARPRFAR